MPIAALLLTGGASRRMGRDKALVVGPDGIGLAARCAAVLAEVADPVVEVGPGHTGLPVAADLTVGDTGDGDTGAGAGGPLAAVAGGVAHLLAAGWTPGPALVVATDLPHLEAGVLRWLAAHPAPGSVVAEVDGRPQWLCARYGVDALLAAVALVAGGERRMAALGPAGALHLAGEDEWGRVAAAPAWRDVDTPADLAAAIGPPQVGSR